jgi:hypothetical protein
LENFCIRRFAVSPQLYPIGPDWPNYHLVSRDSCHFLFITVLNFETLLVFTVAKICNMLSDYMNAKTIRDRKSRNRMQTTNFNMIEELVLSPKSLRRHKASRYPSGIWTFLLLLYEESYTLEDGHVGLNMY